MQIDPNVPRTGSFLFSSAVEDGATALTPEITIVQQIDVSGFLPIGMGGASISASGYFSGSTGCASSSDDTAQIVVEFYSGGPFGTLLGSNSSSPLDPDPGEWRLLSTMGSVPSATDTIVMRVITLLDTGFASINIGVDDLSLTLTTPPVPAVPSLQPFAIRALAVVLLAIGLVRLRRATSA